MFPYVLIINHRIENNLEIHLEEVQPKEIYLESHLLIQLLHLLDGTLDPCMFIPPWHQPHVVQLVSKLATKPQYPTYVKNTDLNVHIRILKKAIKANGEIMKVDIINLFGFTLRDNISKWGEKCVQDHPNYIFEELEQTFCKQFRTIKNNEEVYM
jgi:hypothetical protein